MMVLVCIVHRFAVSSINIKVKIYGWIKVLQFTYLPTPGCINF